MGIKIADLSDIELDGYIKQAKDVLMMQGVETLIAIDPSLTLLVDAKTVYYRLREERAFRDSERLRIQFNEGGLDKLEVDELTRPEMDLAYPELGKYLDAIEKEENEKLKQQQFNKN